MESEESKRKRLLFISATARITVSAGRRYGVCVVEFAPGCPLNFKREFTLPNPSMMRCATLAAILALEQRHLHPEFRPDESHALAFAVGVNNEMVEKVIETGLLSKWESRGWPPNLRSSRVLFLRLRDLCRESDASIVFVKPQSRDEYICEMLEDPLEDLSQDPTGMDAQEKFEETYKRLNLQKAWIGELTRMRFYDARRSAMRPGEKSKLRQQRKRKKRSGDKASDPRSDVSALNITENNSEQPDSEGNRIPKRDGERAKHGHDGDDALVRAGKRRGRRARESGRRTAKREPTAAPGDFASPRRTEQGDTS